MPALWTDEWIFVLAWCHSSGNHSEKTCIRHWAERLGTRSPLWKSYPSWVTRPPRLGTNFARREDGPVVPGHWCSSCTAWGCHSAQRKGNCRGGCGVGCGVGVGWGCGVWGVGWGGINSWVSYSRSPHVMKGISGSYIGGNGTSFRGSKYVFERWASSSFWMIVVHSWLQGKASWQTNMNPCRKIRWLCFYFYIVSFRFLDGGGFRLFTWCRRAAPACQYSPGGPGLTLVPTWISDYIHYKVCDEITCNRWSLLTDK